MPDGVIGTADPYTARKVWDGRRLFTEREKVALDYTVAVMRTPVEVTDELFASVKEHFTEKQMVEITAHLTLVNFNRFNAAFGIGSAGFSDGMVCVLPDRPAPSETGSVSPESAASVRNVASA
ncbi:MAG: carboxymuconolactone decarboxylase family protein [Acidimicrobiales bacterium]